MRITRCSAIHAIVMAVALGLCSSSYAAKGAGHARAGGPIARIREVCSQLNLTDDQQPQVNKILDEAEQKVAQLRQEAKASGDRTATREKAKDLMKETVGKLSHVLTPEQRGKLRELIKEAREEKKAAKAPATQPAAAN